MAAIDAAAASHHGNVDRDEDSRVIGPGERRSFSAAVMMR
jgi:hypothetical protein